MLSRLHHSISPIDENHGLYGNFIGLQYIFERPLKTEVLAKAVAELVNQFPALSGHYNPKSGEAVYSDTAISLKHQQSPRAIKDILASSERPEYVEQPDRRAVLKGRTRPAHNLHPHRIFRWRHDIRRRDKSYAHRCSGVSPVNETFERNL